MPDAPLRQPARANLPRLDRHKPRCGPVRKSRNAPRRAAVLVLLHVAIAAHIVHYLVAGRSLTPLEPSEAQYTLVDGLVNAGFLLFVLAILTTLVAGRWFCGWACHVVALQDLAAWLLARAGIRPLPLRSRLLVLLPFVIAFYMFVWPVLSRWLAGGAAPEAQWHLTTDDLWRTFPGPWMSLLTFAVCGFLLVQWLGAKAFCSFGCPYGALFAVADRAAPVRIRVTDACDACGHCTSVCTSNVRVHEEVNMHRAVVDPACMKCMDCVSVCPKEALYVGIGRPAGLTTSQQRIGARADFTWPEEIALLVLAVGGLLAWRGAWIGDGVPVLLAGGLGAVTAVVGLTLARLCTAPDLTVQGRVWRTGGRRTRAGQFAFAAMLLWLLATGHMGWLGWLAARGENLAVAAMARDTAPAARESGLAAAASHLAMARSHALFEHPAAAQLHGLVLREQRQFEAAERAFGRALQIQPDYPAAAIPLCDLLALRGDFTGARALLERVLAEHPEHAEARYRFERLPR